MRFEQVVDISAPPEMVWSVMADLPRWQEWSGTVQSFAWVEGDSLRQGATARLRLRGAPGATVWTVTQVEEGRSFAWESRIRGVESVATHLIEPVAGGSRVTLAVEQIGLMATLFRPMLSRVSKQNLVLESEGLKRASEVRAGGASA